MIAAARSRGTEVRTCLWPLLHFARQTKTPASSNTRTLLFCLRASVAYPWLLAKLLTKLKGADALWVGTMGHLDVLMAWPLRKILRLPLTFDPLVSLHDTTVADRKLLAPTSLTAKFLWLIDWLAFRAADHLLIDTHAHRDFLVREFKLPLEKFSVVPLKADARFAPMEAMRQPGNDQFIVLFHGKFIPLHGFEKMLRALAIIEGTGERRILLRVAGTGQTEADMHRLAEELKLRNIEWLGWIPHEDVPALIHDADLCLGAFGDSDKAKRVVPNKVWEALACGKRVLSQKMPEPEEDPLLKNVRWLEPTPEAIARAILDEFHAREMQRESQRIGTQRSHVQA
jgi:glycosyltransferase involved in cell wall biosynthesis